VKSSLVTGIIIWTEGVVEQGAREDIWASQERSAWRKGKKNYILRR
jgi:hypothetical protein